MYVLHLYLNVSMFLNVSDGQFDEPTTNQIFCKINLKYYKDMLLQRPQL